MAAIQTAKATLRKDVQKVLLTLSEDEKKRQTEIVLKKLFQLPAFENSKRVSVYLSTDNEISTENIVKKLFDTGKACFVPRYDGNVMQMVRLKDMQDWETLPLTKWKIKQPKLSDKRENALEAGGLDLVIMPGVAFTSFGARLGHGKGYYDTFLTTLKKSQKHTPFTVALAFKEQIQDEVPTHDHDVKIDMVLYSD